MSLNKILNQTAGGLFVSGPEAFCVRKSCCRGAYFIFSRLKQFPRALSKLCGRKTMRFISAAAAVAAACVRREERKTYAREWFTTTTRAGNQHNLFYVTVTVWMKTKANRKHNCGRKNRGLRGRFSECCQSHRLKRYKHS